MLEDGADGVAQDPAAALRWHLAAAEKGNAVQPVLIEFQRRSILSRAAQPKDHNAGRA